MQPLLRLAEDRDMRVIEDCAQAHGAELGGRTVGSFGDVAAFSFCQDKIISTGGEGGMVVTDGDEAGRLAWERKDHGRSLEAMNAPGGGAGYRRIYDSFGTNARMTEMQAALGRVQLRKLDRWVEARRRNAAVLDARLAELRGLRVAAPAPHVRHAHYKYYAYVEPDALASGWSRDRIVAAVNDAGVPCFTGICPEIYREKAFIDRGLAPARRFPVARELGETSVVLLVHPTLGEEHMHRAADVLADVMSRAVG
jgi:dTDP-4-amino-4,6-dideoxygalactose transaminase